MRFKVSNQIYVLYVACVAFLSFNAHAVVVVSQNEFDVRGCSNAIAEHKGECDASDLHFNMKGVCSEARDEVQKKCFSESGRKLWRDSIRNELIGALIAKSDKKNDSVSTELAVANGELAKINEIMEGMAPRILELKNEFGQRLAALNDENGTVLSSYKDNVDRVLRLSRSESSPESLFEFKKEVSSINFKAIESISDGLADLLTIKAELVSAETELFDRIYGLANSFFAEEEFSSLNAGSNLADKAIGKQVDLQWRLVANTKKIQSYLDQKISVEESRIRVGVISEEVRSRLLASRNMSLESDYLVKVQGSVKKLTQPSRSSFYNLQYLGAAYDGAQEIKAVVEFCDATTLETWQGVGCGRAKQFSTNANRFTTLTAKSAISIGANFFTRFAGDGVSDLVALMRSRLAAGDIEAAVSTYDSILTTLEGVN